MRGQLDHPIIAGKKEEAFRWCNSENVVYQVCIFPMEHNHNVERAYIGFYMGNWKRRLYNQHSFSNPQLKNQTALSKCFWNLKERDPSNKVENN